MREGSRVIHATPSPPLVPRAIRRGRTASFGSSARDPAWRDQRSCRTSTALLLALTCALLACKAEERPPPPPPQPVEVAAPLEVLVSPRADTLLTGRLAAFDVRVEGGADGVRTWTAHLGGKRASVIARDDDGRAFLLLAPIDIDDERRELELRLEGTLRDDTPVIVSRQFPVVEAPYETSELKVSRKFTSPSRSQQDRAAVERKRIRDVLTTWTDERLWTGSFLRPTETPETSPFGTKRTLNGVKQSRHLGWDLDGRVGDRILAAQRGRAVLVADLFYSGGTVVLDHGQGLFTLYFHMSAFDVKEGELVERGDLIGKVGRSGRVTGPHLHFAVKLDDTYVDPKQVLSLDLEPAPSLAAAPKP